MKNFTMIIFLLIIALNTRAQDYLISFAGSGASNTVDSVKVYNLSQNTSLTLYGTEVLHLMGIVGIDQAADQNNAGLRIYPNPMNEQSFIEFETASPGSATIEVCDITGKLVTQIRKTLPCGRHTFVVSGLRSGMYTLIIKSAACFCSGKIVSTNMASGNAGISYISSHSESVTYTGLKSNQSLVPMQYTDGNRLLIKCFSDVYINVISLVPSQSQTVTATFVACTDADSNNYATVIIGNQTWMAENLNVGVRIDGVQTQTNNGIIEKYCGYDEEIKCDQHGGLYLWDEMMHYATTPGAQGICPNGWHLPTQGEWTSLITFLGGAAVAGGKMKSTGTLQAGTGLWQTPNTGATNESGFSAVPAGWRWNDGSFGVINIINNIWSSSEENASRAWFWFLFSYESGLLTNNYPKSIGFSVRCLRDTAFQGYLIHFAGSGDTSVVSTVKVDNLTSGATVTMNGGDVLRLNTGVFKGAMGSVDMPYTDGDQLIFKGISGKFSTIVADAPDTSKTITFNFEACTDAENRNYATVTLGTQTWMAENLNAGIRINGSIQGQTNNGVIEKYCYADDVNDCNTYGGLYQWNEMMQYITTPGTQGVCPTGWHIPTDPEWTNLITYLGGETTAGGSMKSTGTTDAGTGLWNTPNFGATNESGFTAVPGGYCSGDGVFGGKGSDGVWWSSSEGGLNGTLCRYIFYDHELVGRDNVARYNGFSVRCVRDHLFQGYLINFEGTGDTTVVNTVKVDNLTSGATLTVNGGDTLRLNTILEHGGIPADEMYYTDGDQLLFKGVSGRFSTIVADIPDTNKTISFNFAACTDADNNHYATVNIGTQTWMAENLNVGVRIDGVLAQTNNDTIEKYCYNNDTNKCSKYGGLYQWDEIMHYEIQAGVQGICPAGWHIPTIEDVDTLVLYLGGFDCAGGKMKSTGTLLYGTGLWNFPNNLATNESGFTALPGGYLLSLGSFYNIGDINFLWTSSKWSQYVWEWYLVNQSAGVETQEENKNCGLSVRCLRD